MITGQQIRAARAMLKWSAKELAAESGVSWATIQRMEAQDGVPGGLAQNVEKLQRCLESAGIDFIAENGGGVGVRLRKEN